MSRRHAHLGNRRFWSDVRAVNEVVDTVLIVGVTLLAAGGITVLIAQQDAPAERANSVFTMRLDEGSSGWGTGDERVLLMHEGGELLEADETRIDVYVGVGRFSFTSMGLGAAFDDGFRVGETWSDTRTIPSGARVGVDVVVATSEAASVGGPISGASATGYLQEAVFSASLTALGADCSADLSAPTIYLWQQDPADVSVATTGDVDVTIEVGDDCAGVDTSIAPRLYSRIRGVLTPAWTDLGAMNALIGGRWTATVPEPAGGWSAYQGQLLEYYVGPVPGDILGNGGTLDSEVRNDTIQPVAHAADLRVAITDRTPAIPYVGGPDVSWEATVTNDGDLTVSGATIRVDFTVDGVALGTATSNAALPSGASVTLTSPDWAICDYTVCGLAQVGIHDITAVVDPLNVIPEALETNNVATRSFTVAPGIFDPGFPYLDPNHDGLYTPALDTAIAASDILDGHYNVAPGNSLVVPPSTGDVTAGQILIEGNENIIIAVNITSTSAVKFHIKSTHGTIRLNDVVLTAQTGIEIEVTQGTGINIEMMNSTLTAGDYIRVRAKDGWIDLTDSRMTAGSFIEAEGTDGDVTAVATMMDAGTYIHLTSDEVNATDSDVDVQLASLTAGTDIILEVLATGETVYVGGATFADTNNKAQILPSTASSVGTPAAGGLE